MTIKEATDPLAPPTRPPPHQRTSLNWTLAFINCPTNLQFFIPTPKTLTKKKGRYEDRPVREQIAEQISILEGKIDHTKTLCPQLQKLNDSYRQEFADCFKEIPHVSQLPTSTYHCIRLKDPSIPITAQSYFCPRRMREPWRILLDQHLTAGHIWPSSSPYSSSAFLVPKSDPTILLRWVNDYCKLNENTVRDRTPLPRIETILANVGWGKIFGKIDITNSFFQTLVHLDDVHLTAVNTPFSMYEWVAMPMGGTNAPATHQWCMTQALLRRTKP